MTVAHLDQHKAMLGILSLGNLQGDRHGWRNMPQPPFWPCPQVGERKEAMALGLVPQVYHRGGSGELKDKEGPAPGVGS